MANHLNHQADSNDKNPTDSSGRSVHNNNDLTENLGRLGHSYNDSPENLGRLVHMCNDLPRNSGKLGHMCNDLPRNSGKLGHMCNDLPDNSGRLVHTYNGLPDDSGRLVHTYKGLPRNSGKLVHSYKGLPDDSGRLVHTCNDLTDDSGKPVSDDNKLPSNSRKLGHNDKALPNSSGRGFLLESLALLGLVSSLPTLTDFRKGYLMTNTYRIEPLTVARLDHSAFFQLMTESREAIASFNKAGQKESAYTTKLAEMDSLLAKLNTLLHKRKSSPLSQPLEEADQERDAAFSTLQNLIKAYRQVKEPSTKEAYLRLAELLKNYRGLSSLSYEKETEGINHLLGQLKEEANQAALAKLHLSAPVASLTQAQKAFAKLYQARLAELESQIPNQTKVVKKDLLVVYEALLDFTAIYSFLHPELVAYQKLLDRLNAIRKRYKPLLSKGKKQTEPTQPTPEVSNPNN